MDYLVISGDLALTQLGAYTGLCDVNCRISNLCQWLYKNLDSLEELYFLRIAFYLFLPDHYRTSFESLIDLISPISSPHEPSNLATNSSSKIFKNGQILDPC
jgi:hypothetical protein